ncbi:class I SAM-dependent methyltransferase [Candidatus Halobonum tyrrellensis]|uniref:Methyltransferase type 11 n=1 Tax=Candidatus Halobonum tyrrellensis G22 TaxID=1324957 RepID=V4HFZ9_9EURY|nr:class I SAM-dependent methyltransferase [Candidatus Halobonum tyrrellensis]ESP89640.1 methyltransferase type 11 [Candidatus Halobonum tyrrellensis G22]
MTPGDERETREAAPNARALAATYDRIAEQFSATREYPWPEVESFLDAREGGVGLDVGCGNGRHAEPLAARVDRVVGVDVSRDLLGVARRRARERGYADALSFVRGDAAALPVADATVDVGVYVAALHHLRGRDRRVASLSELARALAPGGRALVSAWSTEHDRFDPREGDAGFDTSVDWTLPDGETVDRFYHVYHPAEFRADLEASGLRTVEAFVSSGNCYAVVAPGGSSGSDGSDDAG